MIKGWSHSSRVPEGQFWRLMFLKTGDRALNSLSCCVSPLNMHARGVKQMNVHYSLLRGQNKAIQRFQRRSSVSASRRLSRQKHERFSSRLWNSRQTRYLQRKFMTPGLRCQRFHLGLLSPLFSQTSLWLKSFTSLTSQTSCCVCTCWHFLFFSTALSVPSCLTMKWVGEPDRSGLLLLLYESRRTAKTKHV